MTKRKRSSSHSKPASSHPFLVFEQNRKEHQDESEVGASSSIDDDNIFQHVLSFLELSKQKDENPSPMVHKLVSFLEQEQKPMSSSKRSRSSTGLVSRANVASLLLPWAIKHILHSSVEGSPEEEEEEEEHSLFQTLETCLNVLLVDDSNDDKNNTSSILSLSVLHKLVPQLAKIAFLHNGANSITAGRCYCRLVDRMYRPTFDTVCNSLLPIIGGGDMSNTNPNHQRSSMRLIILSTLRLLLLVLPKANPKKSFQMLIRPSTFLVLSSLYVNYNGASEPSKKDDDDPRPLVKKLLIDGIFSLEHHIDGFRSLKIMQMSNGILIPRAAPDANTVTEPIQVDKEDTKDNQKPAFYCYQEGLFAMMEQELNKDPEKNHNTLALVIHAIPLLMEAFLEQSKALKQSIKEKKKKSSAFKIGQLQFRFFACLSTPLLQTFLQHSKVTSASKDYESLNVVLLKALGRNLTILLKEDVYLPSNVDQDEQNFMFLENVSIILIQKMSDSSNSDRMSFVEWKESLKILETLTRLNHLIVHDDITQVLARCLTSSCKQHEVTTMTTTPPSKVGVVPREASSLLMTLIVTYEKLRQLDYFTRSLLKGVETLRDDDDCNDKTERLLVWKLFIEDHAIDSQLAHAVKFSPIHQLKQIFSEMNHWIVQASKKGNGSPSSVADIQSIAVVVRTFAILMKNSRVDEPTANEIYPLCQEILSGAVQGLVDAEGGDDPLSSSCTRDGLMLCGWLIDLKNRCDFWIRNSKENLPESFAIPKQILGILDDAARHFSEEEHDDDDFMDTGKCAGSHLEELQFLACHRIQQLHGEIHEKQRIAFATDAEEYSSVDEIAEARRLAVFALKALHSKKGSENILLSRWKMLAGSIAFWAPYAKQKDLDSFLLNFFFSLAMGNNTELSNDEESAISLLHDASFYETANVSKYLGPAAMSCTAKLIQKALACSTGMEEVPYNDTDLSCPMRHETWVALDAKRLNAIIEEGALDMSLKHCKEAHINEMKSFLTGGLRCLMILNGMPASIWVDCECIVEAFDSAMRLDLLLGSLLHTGICDLILELVTALRVTSAQILRGLRKNTGLGDKTTPRKLLSSLFHSTIKMLDSHELNRNTRLKVVNSSKQLIAAIIEYCVTREDLSLELAEGVNHVFPTKNNLSDNEILVYTTFGRSIIKQISTAASMEDDTRLKITYTIQHSLWDNAFRIAFSPNSRDDPLNQEASLYLVAELLRMEVASGRSSWLTEEKRRSIEAGIIQKCKVLRKTDGPEWELQSVSYLLACVAQSDPTPEARRELATELLKPGMKSNIIIENAFCALVKKMDSSDLSDFMEKISSPFQHNELATQLKLFQLIIVNLTSTDQVEVISKFSRRFLSKAVQFLAKGKACEKSSSDRVGIDCATDLIIEMASSKDVISIRERDIAMILVNVNSAMNRGRSFSPPSGGMLIVPIESQVYNSCFSLVSFLLQRFSKQLHYCVPSLIRTMTAMLQHSLYGDELPESQIADRGQKFTRLCELLLPHGEVYKKHILCLLVEYVQALRGGDMPLSRKNSLAPAIYCLLDILQQHETTQLNSMLDDMGRALLRSVHESYKKLHVYKGQ